LPCGEEKLEVHLFKFLRLESCKRINEDRRNVVKLKQGLSVFILALFLAACGTQTPAPQLPVETEQVIELGGLAPQTTPKHDQIKAVFVKKIKGYAPHNPHYKVVLSCKVKEYKGKHHYYKVVKLIAKFDGEGKASGYVPRKLLGSTCVVSEKGTLGEKVVFRVIQTDKDDGKWDDLEEHESDVYREAIKTYGKDHVSSKKFYLKDKGEVLRVVTINVYKKEEPKKELEIKIVKKFSEYPHKYDLKFYLVCNDNYKDEIAFHGHKDGYLVFYETYKDRYGKKCEIVEVFKSYKYELKKVHVYYEIEKYGHDSEKGDYKIDPYYDEHYKAYIAKTGEKKIEHYYKKIFLKWDNYLKKVEHPSHPS